MSARLLAGLRRDGALTLAEHEAIHGPLPRAGRELIDAVAEAGLRGRGGAGFPAAIKLAAVARGRRPVVVVNGTEGEPMSGKDRLLLTRAPHLVIDGAELAAAAVGAREILLAAPANTHGALGAALAERRTRGVTLTESAPGYVAGEETAVIAHLEGRPPRPRLTPPRPAERGFKKRPTLVQNVETLAHLALIARHGPAWFRATGTDERPGTTLLTVSGAVGAEGVMELAPGVTLGRALDPSEPLRAVLVGGYFGAWVPADEALTLDDATLAAHGAALGAGVIVALGESSCPIAKTARITSYMAAESAGQCGPCVHGLGALAGVLERLAAGRGERDDAARLVRWTEMVRGRGACAHPDGVARMLASATRMFAEELDDHAHRGACSACARPRVLEHAA
jgi:NADH:ubiquinone oxidoreductase subunit F (NADH-binding)